MKIKKFVGATMNECLLQVKKELGDNAIILDSKKISRGGPFSFLMNDMVEVTASTPDPNPPPDKGSRDWSRMAQKVEPETPPGVSLEEFELLSDEIKSLKDTVLQMADHMKFDKLPSLPKPLEHLHRDLLENGVDAQIANALTQEITLQLSGEAFEDRPLLVRTLRERVSRVLRAAPFAPAGARPWVIALVGPTGVGKTTTLAKMATHPDLFGRKRVALVSADTYRIAAVEQLKTFASIAGVPMEAVYRPSDIRRVIDRFSDHDVILIDTAGRSQNNRDQLRDLAAFMEFAKPDDVHLVLSVSTRLEDQLDVIEKFKVIGPSRLLFTKLDETTNLGMLLNVCFHERKPVSLLTCGQNVPDDVMAPNQLQLVRLVCEKSYYQDAFMKEVVTKWATVK
jgi:flagellar biosynthesis protein FlhF